ncbi:MAG: FHA domain-containing protein [Aestuariibacter sp.]|nr:FHA domain-containing protein [Aestuariibacter sp.]
MENLQLENIRNIEGRTFIIGRSGHIYLDSPAISKYHAEIKIIDGKVFLRDLNSSNGTYLLKDQKLERFEEGYVSMIQSVVIGNQKHIIQDLLKTANAFAATNSDATVELEFIQPGAMNQSTCS